MGNLCVTPVMAVIAPPITEYRTLQRYSTSVDITSRDHSILRSQLWPWISQEPFHITAPRRIYPGLGLCRAWNAWEFESVLRSYFYLGWTPSIKTFPAQPHILVGYAFCYACVPAWSHVLLCILLEYSRTCCKSFCYLGLVLETLSLWPVEPIREIDLKLLPRIATHTSFSVVSQGPPRALSGSLMHNILPKYESDFSQT